MKYLFEVNVNFEMLLNVRVGDFIFITLVVNCRRYEVRQIIIVVPN